MLISQNPLHIFEPNPLACGQAVLAMLSDSSVEDIFRLVKTDRETTLKDMFGAFDALEIGYDKQRMEISHLEEMPEIALLSLETPHCWHWSLYFHGTFYDPEYGVLKTFPPSYRKYCWKLYEK